MVNGFRHLNKHCDTCDSIDIQTFNEIINRIASAYFSCPVKVVRTKPSGIAMNPEKWKLVVRNSLEASSSVSSIRVSSTKDGLLEIAELMQRNHNEFRAEMHAFFADMRRTILNMVQTHSQCTSQTVAPARDVNKSNELTMMVHYQKKYNLKPLQIVLHKCDDMLKPRPVLKSMPDLFDDSALDISATVTVITTETATENANETATAIATETATATEHTVSLADIHPSVAAAPITEPAITKVPITKAPIAKTKVLNGASPRPPLSAGASPVDLSKIGSPLARKIIKRRLTISSVPQADPLPSVVESNLKKRRIAHAVAVSPPANRDDAVTLVEQNGTKTEEKIEEGDFFFGSDYEEQSNHDSIDETTPKKMEEIDDVKDPSDEAALKSSLAEITKFFQKAMLQQEEQSKDMYNIRMDFDSDSDD